MADLRRNALFQAYDEEYAADRARTIASMGPQPIDPSRPILSNSDGTFPTEKTFSIDFDGKYILLPQIVNGRDVGQEEAARMFFRKEISPIAVHDSLEESNSYAQQRSNEIGELRGRGGDLGRVKEWFKDPEFVKLPLQTKKETLGRFFDAESPPEFKQLPPDKFAWSRNKFIETQIGENRPEPPSRGVVSDIGVSAARGVLGTGGLIARGAAGADELLKHYGVADLGIAKRAREFDKAVNEYKEETFPTSKEAREPGWRKTWTGGFESAVTSLGAAAPLAAIGAVAGAAGPVGAFGGAAIGYIMGAPMFGLSQYDTALEKYKKAGLPKDEAHMGALFEGMHETGWELVSNALDIVTLKFGGLVSKPVKNAAAGAVQRTIRSSFLEAGKRGLAIAGVEGSSELATSGFQAETEHAYGEEYGMKTQRFWDAVTEQFGQIAVSSLIFGALGAGGHKALTRSTTRSLEDENAPIENRVAAVKTVYGELRRKYPSLAKAWIESATAAIENKKPITTNIGDESIYEKPKGREESFFERITSDVAEGRVTAEELQQVRQGMPDTDPRAQAIDRFFAGQKPEAQPAPPAGPAEQPPSEPLRTPEARQAEIYRQSGETPPTPAELRQREINTLWEKYEQGAAGGAYESKKDLVDEMRADARDAGQQIPNPEIKRLADRVWAMAKRSERNPEVERTRQRVEDIPRRAEEAKRALSWEEVLRTTPVNIESASPYDGMPAVARESAPAEKPIQAAPEQVAPTVAPPAKPTIEFKTNEEAVEFGTKATPEQVSEMRRLYEESKAKSSELIKGDDLDAAMKEGTRGQFYRESIEASEGRHPTQIAAAKSQPIETQPAAVKVDGVKAEEAPRESRRDRSMREYRAYVGSLPEASREAVKDLIDDNPQSPSVQARKIQKAVAEFEKKPVPKPGPVEVDRKANEAATSPKNTLPQPTQAQKEAGTEQRMAPKVAEGASGTLQRVSQINQPVRDSVLADTNLFGDSANTQAIASKGFESFERNVQHVILSKMTAALNDKKVFEAVVESVPIDVVNNLVVRKFSSDKLFNDPAVLRNRLTIPGDKPVPKPVVRFINALASSVKDISARLSAEESGLQRPPFSSKSLSTSKANSQRGLNAGPATEGSSSRSDIGRSSGEFDAAGRTHKHDDGHVVVSIVGKTDTVDTTPSEAQKQAGVYKKGHFSINGLDISIENPAGSAREGVSKEGKPWKTVMKNHYGYVKGTKGFDKDQLDIFLGPRASDPNAKAFVVDQVDPDTGKFDEHKIMFGFETEQQARDAYQSNYQKGWKGFGAVSEMSLDELKKWAFSPGKKSALKYREAKAENPKPAEPEVKIIEKTEEVNVKTDLTKKQEAALAPKDQKKYLLAEIDKTIKGVPDKPIEGKTVTFEVPGDGEFTVAFDKEVLKNFREIVEKRWPENSKRVKQVHSQAGQINWSGIEKKFYDKVKNPSELTVDEYRKIRNGLGEVSRRDNLLYGSGIEQYAVNQVAFDNWLLGQNITREVKGAIRETATGGERSTTPETKLETTEPEGDKVGAKETEQGVAMFAKGRPRKTRPSGMEKGALDPVIERIASFWKNGPAVKVVQRQHELPEGIITWLKKAGAYDDIVRGVFHKDRVYLVADNFDNSSDAVRTLMHESFGHFGIRRMLGDQWSSIMDQAYRSHGDAIRQVAKEYGYDISTEKGRNLGAEEWLAREAETNPKSTIVERVVAAIRRMLRRLGLGLEMTDGEVRDLLVRAREYVQTGRPANMLKVFKGAMFEKQGREQLWYSQMERVLGQKLPGKGNPKAIASMLEGWARKGEYKSEELEWSGISDWLKEHKAAIVTKSEVMEWLAANNVQVQEVVKSEQKGRKTEDQANEDLTEYVDLLYEKYPDASTIDELEKQISVYEKRRLNELNNALNDAMRDPSGGGDLAVYSQYQTPGGSNYRELLLTLPEKQPTGKEGPAGWAEVGNARSREGDQNFRSTHYQEANILAHVRFNERTDADGRKVLFIDEIQSDWAQKGRKEGFKTGKEKFKVDQSADGLWFIKTEEGQTLWTGYQTRELAESDAADYARRGLAPNNTVPDAPFVKETGKWSMLAMRRIVRWAAEHGMDRIAWTTGEMQAARYDLSKHVETIGYQKRGDNFNITVWGKNGEKIWQNQSATAKEVEDTIGKEMLEKMNNEQGRSESGLHYLEGLDLKVGGEGMKGFYDKILPAEVNKFFNKQAWGNARVGETKIPIPETVKTKTTTGGGITQELNLEAVEHNGEWLVIDNSPFHKSIFAGPYDSRSDAEAFIKNTRKTITVHSLDINDVMREKAMGGMPLFSKKKQQAKTYLDRLNEAPEFKGMKADLAVPPDTRGMLRDVRKWARNRFGKGYVDRDMKRLNKVLETPYGLSKKFPSMAKAMKTELDASEDRSKILFNDYDKTGLSELQDHLRKNKAHQREITGLIWKWDGNRFPRRSVPTEAINFPADITDDLTINEGHYTEMREFLGKQGVTPEVADGFVNLRRLLDKKLVEIDKVMRVEDLDAELITQYRGEIGKINNYFPHRRSGNSHVTVINRKKRGTDDAVVYREHYFSQLDRLQPVEGKARARAEKWLREAVATGKLPGQVSDYDISQGAVKQLPDEVFFQIPIEGMQQLADVAGRELEKSRVQYEAERLLKNGEVGSMAEGIELAQKRLRKDMGAALSKAIAEVFKSRGWARSAIPRKGIPGHETEDVFGILFDYLSGFAGFKTKIQRAREHSATLHSINAKSRPEEYRYVSNYVKDMLANQDATDRAVDTVRGLFFLKYLGFVLKSGVVNLTQNVVMSAPRLSIETSHANAKLYKAMFDVRKALYSKAAILGKEVQYEGLNASERRMLHEMTEQGISIDQFLRELKGHIPGKNIYSQAIRNFVDKSGIFMQLAERFNRASTALAAYRVGVNEKGMDHEKAVEFAKGIVYDSHFVYGKHNLPMWARGGQARKYIRSAYTFRAFTHNYLNMIHYMATKQGIRGKLAVARSLRNTILVGGLASFPFFKALGSAVMWALGDDDKDAMTAIREQLPNTWIRDLLTYGLPGVAGVDISGSLSLDMPREWYEILGVPYAVYKDTLNMIESWKSGQTMRAVAESPITPMMVRNAMRGLELYTTGQHTRSGRPLNAPGEVGPRKIDEIDLMKKAALGFQPIEISKGYAQSQALNKAMDKADEKKKYLSDRYVNAMIRDNKSEMSEVLAEVFAWNEKMYQDGKPHLAIDLRGSIKARLAQPIQKIPKAMRGNALRTAEAWQ